jgi:hypothetical protein
MNFSNHIMDHNDRVAHSSSWYEPDDPLDDVPNFTKADFNLPEPIEAKCQTCGETVNHCDICGEPFDLEVRVQVVCGNLEAISVGPRNSSHICYDCWDNLPEGEQ